MRAYGLGTSFALIAVTFVTGCSTASSPSPSTTIPPASVTATGPAANPSAAAMSPAPSGLSDLAGTLNGGTWRILSATGISDIARLSPVEFREALLVGTGVCGFASDVSFPGASAIDIKEVYWDAVICKDNDPADSRLALKAILDAVTEGVVSTDGSVMLSGPAGEVALSR